MADRYWVGGAGTWDSTDTTHWSASSGGAAGASAPTSADNVFFDTLSNATAYAVTIGLTAVAANAADISISGPLVGNVTITSAATSVLNCYGSWLNAATGVVFTSTSGSIVNFLATSTGKTITTNGVSVSNLQFNLNSTTGGWELGSAFITTTFFTITAGSFSTSASNWGLTVGTLSSTGTGVRSISLNASLVSCTLSTQVNLGTPATLTFNAGTSSIVCSTTTSAFGGGGQTFYNVSYTSVSQASANIAGANTFNNLTFPVKTLVGVANINFSADQIVTGTLTMAGSTYNTRFQLVSATLGTPRTFTAGAVSLAYVDFRDIVGAGTATWTGTSIGDCFGNTNITFDAPKTVYRNLAGAQLWAANGWAASSGGAPAVASYPLPQDTAIFDDVGAAGTISSWAANTGSVDMSARTLSSPFTATNTFNVYGNWINGTGTVLSGVGTIQFLGRSLQTITPAGITFGSGITVTAFGGTVRIEAALISTSTLVLNNGTLDLNDFTYSTPILSSNNTATRSIAFGTGDITLTGNAAVILAMANATGFTYTGTPIINATYSGSTGTRTYQFGSTGVQTEAQALSINVTAGGDAFTFSNGARLFNIDFTGTYSGLATFGTGTFVCYGDFTLNSVMTTASSTGFIFASTSATPRTITSAGQTLNISASFSGIGGTWVLQDNLTFGTTSTITLTAGTLDLNNQILSTGLFTSTGSGVRTIAFGTGNVTCTGVGQVFAVTSTIAITGTPLVNVTSAGSTLITVIPGPLSEANAISFNFTDGTYPLNFLGSSGNAVRNVDFTGFAGTWLGIAGTSIYGDLKLSSGMVIDPSTSTLTFASTSPTPRTIESSGNTIDFPVTFSGVGGTVQLVDAMTVGSTRRTTLSTGTLELNNQTLSTGLFFSDNLNIRTVAFGTGNITVTGSGTTIVSMSQATNFTRTGIPTVNLAYAGSTGTRVIDFGSIAGELESNVVNYNITAGSDTIGISNGSAIGALNFTGFTGSFNFGTASRVFYGDMTFVAGMTVVGGASTSTFASTLGTQQITSAGQTFDCPITFNGVGGTFALQDAMTLGATRTMTLTNGTLDASLAGFTTGVFSSSNSNIRSLIVGVHSYTMLGAGTSWDVTNTTNFTLVGAPSASIDMQSASSNTFSGGLLSDGSSWPNIYQRGAGALTIAGGGLFISLIVSLSYGSPLGPVLFTGGASYYFSSGVLVFGGPGEILTLGSTSTTPASLSKPTAWLMGVNSIDAGNNTGLTFGVGDGDIDYVSVSYIDGHIPTTLDADCAETATSTAILTPNGIFGVVLAAASATATDSTTRSTLWNIIDDTQIPGWTPIPT